MIMEERDYRVKAGKLAEFVKVYETYGLEIQKQYLGTFHGYFTTEIGELNHVVAWWSYADLNDRQARREKMLADPRWSEYLTRAAGLLDVQNSRILKPVSFSPLK